MAGLKRKPSERRSSVIGAPPSTAASSSARARRLKRSVVNPFANRMPRKRPSTQASSLQPPVLVRRGFQDMATPIRGTTKRQVKEPRRRYDVTLNVPGAEVRLPSLPVVHFSWRIASGLLVAMMALSLYLLLFSTVFQADVLEVEGIQRLTMSDLGLVLDITGEPVVSLDPAIIRQDLLRAFPDLKEAQIWINLPASVHLEVEERQPVVAWVKGNETVWVDEEGFVFPQRGEFSGSLLTVSGESLPLVSPLTEVEGEQGVEAAAERLEPKMIQVLLSMSQYLPAGTAMAYDPAHGFGWNDERGWQVYFGSRMDDIDQKLNIYQVIVERLQAEGIQPALISMEYLHAPYYRMER